MKRRFAIAVSIVAAALLGGLFGRLWAARTATLGESLQLFSRVVGLVVSGYVEDVEPAGLIKSAIRGMFDYLDPHTELLEKEEYSELKTHLDAEFGGVGINIGIVGERLTVIAPIEGTPAERAGIRAGDRIAEIEGKTTQGFSTDDAIKVLRGTPGTKVKIGIDRPGVAELIPIEITRAVINIKAVPYAGMVDKDVGYVRLADFSKVATRELSQALDSLFGVGAKKIIFDLRLNGGGLLAEGHDVSDLFLDKGQLIVSTKGRVPESRRELVDENPAKYPDFPMVVLVDRGSASAAEIVAGALQDWERGLILGDTTFGKGSVQTIHPMSEDLTVKMTTAYWYTPSGRCINRPRDANGELKKDSVAPPAQVYSTLGKLHRKVYGGGAIVPDVYLGYERLSGFAIRVNRDAYFDFSVDYYNGHPGLTLDFVADEPVLARFKTYLRDEKKLEFTDAAFDSARDWFATSIEREVGGKIAGMRGDYIRLRRDPHVKKAVELLASAGSSAEMLARLK